MSKDLIPKCKQCRRAGEKLFLKGDRCFSVKCAIVKRNYIPGQHGNKRAPRLTEFGTQLQAKQKVKRVYRLRETQFRNTFVKAAKQKGKTGENLFVLLEMRLDNVVFRSGLASSRTLARQIVNHGHFTVNGKFVSIPSYVVKVGDVIAVADNKQAKEYWKQVQLSQGSEKQEVPEWLAVDRKKLQSKVLKSPDASMLAESMQSHLVVEFYSH